MGEGSGLGQLILPIPGLHPPPPPRFKIPRAERVSVNRDLKMTSIDWVGFDMDYTLAIYRQAAMDSLSVEVTVERLVRRGYPEYLRELTYDYRFPIRGLLVDKKLGNVLKMNRFKVVRKGYHGMQRLPKEVIRAYNNRRIRPQQTERYHWIDTLFSLSEVASYVALTDALEARGAQPDYARLFDDVRASIDEAHRDGTVYDVILHDLPRFVEPDPFLAQTLHKFRSAGKRLFLLTNSPWHYTERMMTYLLGGAMPEYPTWRHYFDIAIVSAQKPKWFQDGRPLMMREGDELLPARSSLERGVVYEGGNLRDFEHRLGVPGSAILYVGDHIYGDILRSKKESAWRTAMIIQELDAETDAHEASLSEMARQRQLEESRDNLEDELRFYQARYKELLKLNGAANGDGEKARVKAAIERIRYALRTIAHEHATLRDIIDARFQPYWGSLLKEQNEMSIFGLQVETYADIYMRRVSCLRHYSPLQFFRSAHDVMPHER
jgi:5'-nucleotidase